MALATFRDIVIDCANPVELAKFWTQVLGYPVIRQDEEKACLDSGDGSMRIWLVRVPEPKTVKNRTHIDVNLRPGTTIEQLVDLGAEVLRPFGSVPGAPWAVLADPEHNEFCAFPPD
jgi:predicted enzyme related to lactoylglutathione lyase